MSESKTDFLKASWWTGSGWLFALCGMLVVIGSIYILTHNYNDSKGREYIQLDKEQLKIIKKLLDESGGSLGSGASGVVSDTGTSGTSTGAGASGAHSGGAGKSGTVTSAADSSTTSKSSVDTSRTDTTKTGKSGGKSGAGRSNANASKTNTSGGGTPDAGLGSTTVNNTTLLRRNNLIIKYLKDEYNDKLLETDKLDSLMLQMNNATVYDYLTEKRLLLNSPFWLTGGNVYIEAFLWSLLGVLVSLIFYVSTANANAIKSDVNDDIGPFDVSQIPSQIAKMFYAPAVTIVIVLAYHFLMDSNSNLVDLDVNKGLIVFSFIAGFFSGRLMKFLDRLKDLLLPIGATSSSASSTATTNTTTKKDITVKLKLSDTLAADTNAQAITANLKTAKVTLTSATGGNEIPLTTATDSNNNTEFTAKQVVLGDYKVKALMQYKKDDATVIKIAGESSITITNSKNDFEILVDKSN